MKSKERPFFEKLLKSALNEYITGVIEQKNLFLDLNVAELKTLINFYTYALLGLLIEYSSKKVFAHSKLINQLHKILVGELKFE